MLPIASVITPAALTITAMATNPVPWDMVRVPNVDFLSLKFANLPVPPGLSVIYTYAGPQFAVEKIVRATAAQGSILPISAPRDSVNSSWVLDFPGPSITCTNVGDSTLDAIRENINAAAQTDYCTTSFGYIAWVPFLGPLPFSIVPINDTSNKYGLYTLQDATHATLGPFSNTSQLSSIPATLYIATFPNMTNEAEADYGTTNCRNGDDATILKCELYNSSYHVSFSFVNGVQTINITRDKTSYNPVAVYDGPHNETGAGAHSRCIMII